MTIYHHLPDPPGEHPGAPVRAPRPAFEDDPARRGPKLWQVLVQTFVHVFVTPVRDGRPEWRSWSPGLRLVAVVGLAAIVVTGLVATFGSVIRRHSTLVATDEFMVLPQWGPTLFLWLSILVVSLLFTASVHTHPAIAGLVWLVVCPTLLLIPGATNPLGLLLGLVTALVLLFMPLVVRRRGWSIWQFLLIWVLVTATVQFPLWNSPFSGLGVDLRGLQSLTITLALASLSYPAVAAAGYSATEVAVTAGQWFAHSVRNLGGSFLNRWLLALVLLTGVWQLWSIARRVLDPGLEWYAPVLIGSAIIVVVTAGGAWLMWRSSRALRDDPRNVWPVGMPSTLAEAWNPFLLLFGFMLALPLFPYDIVVKTTAMVQALHGPAAVVSAGEAAGRALSSAWFRTLTRLGAALVFAWWAWRRTRRGQAHFGLLAAAMVAVWGLSFVNRVSGDRLLLGWSVEAITTYTSLAAWVWFVVAVVRRRLHNGTLLAIWVVWLVATAFQGRAVLSDPSTIVGAVSASGLVLAGLAWRLLTDGSMAQGDSRAFPRASRVLLLVANTLLATTTLAVIALSGGHHDLLVSSLWEGTGEAFLGTPLLLAVLVAPFLVTTFTFHQDD
ncbi:hypothetical protein ACSDQ9_08715 [Aestuariimicrobium soli]|uniref:hypothetical protein n=1 Tax=Aestuariimicrobium soli TaxID=2035834 RepID=UPI003EB6ED6E